MRKSIGLYSPVRIDVAGKRVVSTPGRWCCPRNGLCKRSQGSGSDMLSTASPWDGCSKEGEDADQSEPVRKASDSGRQHHTTDDYGVVLACG